MNKRVFKFKYRHIGIFNTGLLTIFFNRLRIFVKNLIKDDTLNIGFNNLDTPHRYEIDFYNESMKLTLYYTRNTSKLSSIEFVLDFKKNITDIRLGEISVYHIDKFREFIKFNLNLVYTPLISILSPINKIKEIRKFNNKRVEFIRGNKVSEFGHDKYYFEFFETVEFDYDCSSYNKLLAIFDSLSMDIIVRWKFPYVLQIRNENSNKYIMFDPKLSVEENYECIKDNSSAEQFMNSIENFKSEINSIILDIKDHELKLKELKHKHSLNNLNLKLLEVHEIKSGL